jgi:hypothetical protein
MGSGDHRRALLGPRARGALSIALAALAGCDRGCHGTRLRDLRGGVGSALSSGALPLNTADCPDGLARCSAGVVSVSRLATLRLPCQGPPGACSCPWDWAAECTSACVADDVELVVERAQADRQLCAPAADAGLFVVPAPAPAPSPGELCDEGQRYLCAGGQVVDCASGRVVGLCVRGCFAEGTSIDDDAVSREAAFAILCSR